MENVALVDGVDTYNVIGPDCHGKPSQVQTVEFNVPPNRVITHLSQNCIAGPCGWSYSTKENAPNNYNISYDLENGATKAIWTRKHTSHSVTYQVYVHWKALS